MNESQPSPPREPDHVHYGTSGDDRRLLPKLSAAEWVTFTILAALMAGANIYTTLLIGWGDTGSIVAVLASVLVLGLISRHRPSVHVLNLGQTMVSAGGSIGFAVASYAAVRIVQPDFDPPAGLLIVLFAAMGAIGAMYGSSVRQYMVRYFFPSGTACAVIQTSVAREVAPGERNRPVWMLKVWGSLAALLTIPTKVAKPLTEAAQAAGEQAHAIFQAIHIKLGAIGQSKALEEAGEVREIGIGVDPLYYGIGIVVGPRIGVGMLLGALGVPFLIEDGLESTGLAAETGDWVKWLAIAVLTLPTFATILFAYFFRTPPVIPPGFQPGRTSYAQPANRALVYGILGSLAAFAIAVCAQLVFELPWHVSLITMIIAWPLCVVNGRVTGDTDINPVRLVAIVLLSAFFWMISEGAIAMLGMAVVGGTLASVAVDMMQDYRTGYLVDANPVHQTSVQLFGVVIGSIVAIPVLGLLVAQLGIGEGSSLPAPGAQVWAAMAKAMAGGFAPSGALILAIVLTSAIGSLYAYLTVWPRTAPWMPSIFGLGIGMLVGTEAAVAIFLGGLLKWIVTRAYTWNKRGEELERKTTDAGNDTMLAGASIFAAGAVISILIVLLKTVLDSAGVTLFEIAH